MICTSHDNSHTRAHCHHCSIKTPASCHGIVPTNNIDRPTSQLSLPPPPKRATTTTPHHHHNANATPPPASPAPHHYASRIQPNWHPTSTPPTNQHTTVTAFYHNATIAPQSLPTSHDLQNHFQYQPHHCAHHHHCGSTTTPSTHITLQHNPGGITTLARPPLHQHAHDHN